MTIRQELTLTVNQKERSKKVPCYFCKQEVLLLNGKIWNLDGSEHKHAKNQKRTEDSNGSSDNKKRWSDAQRRAYFAKKNYYNRYGNEENYNRYNDSTYEERRQENQKSREEYKRRYYNKSISETQAFEVLEIFEDLKNLDKKQIFNLVKLAYRRIALRFHEDKNVTTMKFNETVKRCIKCFGYVKDKFVKATEAYELLEAKYGGLN